MQAPKIDFTNSTSIVYFYIGLTFMRAQALEECFMGLLVGSMLREGKMEYTEIQESLSKCTLGQAIKRAKKFHPFDKETEALLSLALEKRNWFIHNYYLDSFSMIFDERGHKKVISDLLELSNTFRSAEFRIAPISHELMLDSEMTDDDIKALSKEAIQNQLIEKGTIE